MTSTRFVKIPGTHPHENITVIFRKDVGQRVWTGSWWGAGTVTLCRSGEAWEANFYRGEDRFQAEGRTMALALGAVIQESK